MIFFSRQTSHPYFVFISFLPGQEAGNVDVVLESGFGNYCEDPPEIATEVGEWLQDSSLMNSMSLAATKAGNPYAADEIVTDIGSQTVAWMKLNEK
jgi:1,2-diacylglycerol 3-beta-galactosyltransferase